jgi:hypothetical protein
MITFLTIKPGVGWSKYIENPAKMIWPGRHKEEPSYPFAIEDATTKL